MTINNNISIADLGLLWLWSVLPAISSTSLQLCTSIWWSISVPHKRPQPAPTTPVAPSNSSQHARLHTHAHTQTQNRQCRSGRARVSISLWPGLVACVWMERQVLESWIQTYHSTVSMPVCESLATCWPCVLPASYTISLRHHYHYLAGISQMSKIKFQKSALAIQDGKFMSKLASYKKGIGGNKNMDQIILMNDESFLHTIIM